MNDAPRYIQEAVNKVMQAIEDGKDRILLSLAISHIPTIVQILQTYCSPADIRNKRILILTDRLHLANQALEQLSNAYNNVNVALLVTSPFLSGDPIVIATTQKFFTKMEKSDLGFDLVFVLGCERVLGRDDDYKQFALSHFKGIIIGIDSWFKNSSKFLGEPVFRYSLHDSIKEGILLPYRVIRVSEVLNIEEKQRLDEYFKNLVADLDEEYEKPKSRALIHNSHRIKEVAESLVSKINNEKTIVFCNTQEEARMLSESLNSMVNESFTFTTISTTEDVPALLRRFIRDESPVVLTTVDLLTSGVDLPNVKNIVLLRYIRSASLLSQILALGLKPYDGKEYLNVYDYVGVFDNQEIVEEINNSGTPIDLPNEAAVSPEPENKKKDTASHISKTTIIFRDRQHINGVLGVKDIAEELAEVIKILPGERGSMIGVFGKWGRGKTFLMDEVWNKLNDGISNERVDFHAWKYQDTPASWAYLYEVLLQKYTAVTNKTRLPHWLVKIFRVAKLNYKRNGWPPILKFLTIVIFFTALWFELQSLSQSKIFQRILELVGITTSLTVVYKLAAYLKKKQGKAAINLFLQYSKTHSYKEHMGLQAEIQKELITLLKTWIPEKHIASRKIVIFVDDIDRCSEHKIIQLIDSLRVMLEDDEVSKRVIVITAIDERILKYAIRSKYHAILKEGEALNINALTKEYLDKLFIIGIKLGDLSSQERDEFFLEFIKDDIRRPVLYPEFVYEDIENNLINAEMMEPDTAVTQQPQIGVESTNGKPQIETANIDNANREKVNRADKLYPEEIAMLRSCLKSYDNATPRQIRIFYYRFLMAKNLLIKQYSFLGRNNIWLTPQYNEIFIKLIIVYSQQEDALLITQHKVEILHTQTPEVKVFLLNEVVVPTPDYGELLKALDIVLAY